MKKNLLIILTLFVGFSLHAQSIKLYQAENEITTDSITVAEWDDIAGYETFLSSHFKMENTSSADLNVKLKVYVAEINDETNLQVCSSGVCVVVTNSYYEFENSIAISSGETLEGWDGIHDSFSPGDNWFDVSGIVRYTVFDELNPTDSVSVVVKYRKETGSVGIEEANIIDGIYPNPANSYLTIDYSFERQNIVAEVYSVIGAKLQNIEIDHTQNSINIDTGNFPNGLYYIRFKSSGKSFRTEKFVVNHN